MITVSLGCLAVFSGVAFMCRSEMQHTDTVNRQRDDNVDLGLSVSFCVTVSEQCSHSVTMCLTEMQHTETANGQRDDSSDRGLSLS